MVTVAIRPLTPVRAIDCIRTPIPVKRMIIPMAWSNVFFDVLKKLNLRPVKRPMRLVTRKIKGVLVSGHPGTILGPHKRTTMTITGI